METDRQRDRETGKQGDIHSEADIQKRGDTGIQSDREKSNMRRTNGDVYLLRTHL